MLRVGRLKETVYDRSVKKQVHNDKAKSAPFLVRTVTVDGWTLAASRLVANMVNAFAVIPADLSQITVSVTMPEGTQEPDFRSFMKELGKLCAQCGIWLTVDEARVSKSVMTAMITAVGMGTALYAEDRRGSDDPAKTAHKDLSAMDIVVAGSVACEGAAMLAIDHEDELKQRFAQFYVDRAKQLFDAAAMPAVRDILLKEDACGTAVREGGIFAGLWEMAAAHKVGLDIDLSAIPIRQHTIEVCEYFDLNPYMLLSGGCLLIMTRRGEAMVNTLAKEGIISAVVGHSTSGNDRIIRYDDEIRYLEPPKADEINKCN